MDAVIAVPRGALELTPRPVPAARRSDSSARPSAVARRVAPRRVGHPGLKRLVDVVLAAALLAATAPLLAAIAVAVRIDSGGPVLFRQVRLGRDRRSFRICKFRSMVVDSEAQVDELDAGDEAQGPLFKMADDPRCTRVGRILRRWSLDELPQLWNVLAGDMSLVGPRPPLPHEVEADGFHQAVRLRVRPGMTGLWQVSGRSLLPYDEMVALDLAYVRSRSLALDLRILLRTVSAVLTGKGAF